MLDPADILVHGHPVFRAGLIQGCGIEIGAAVPEKIPGRFNESVHGVRLAARPAAALGAVDIDEALHFCQRVPPFPGKLHIYRQHNRQVLLRDRNSSAFFTVDDRDRVAPVSLPGNTPVTEAEVDGFLPDALAFKEIGNFLLRLTAAQPVELGGIYHDTFGNKGFGHHCRVQRLPLRLYHDLQRKGVLLRELEIPLVMGRHRHNRTGPVIHKHEIRQVDRHAHLRHRIDAVGPGEDPFLLEILSGSPRLFGLLHFGHERFHRRPVFRGRQLQGLRMFRGKGHERGAEQGVLARRENLD